MKRMDKPGGIHTLLSLPKTISADIDDANRLARDEVFEGHR